MFQEAAREGTVDCVLCLGAGLDARPWRLPLSNSLRWIEVDFEPILDYKHDILKSVAPGCRLERITSDLNDAAGRATVLQTALALSSRVLLVTEGLLFYLPRETVQGMAAEMASCYGWILDISPQTSVLLAGGGDSMREANELRHDTRLEGPEILEVLNQNGWTAAASKTFMKDGAPFAVQRMQRNGWTPDPNMP